MKILILEDEPVHAKYLTKLLNNILDLSTTEISHVASVDEAYLCLKQTSIDLFFLDLNIFGSDSFEVLDRFPEKTVNTIVVSANPENAVRAFEYGVIDFLTKPVSEERLRLSLERYSFFTNANLIKIKNNTKSRLLKVNLDQLENRLSQLMEVEKIYRNEDLSLEVLAEELELHPRQLSEYLNEKKRTNFSSFLHSYRIKETKYLLETYPEKKISDIGFEVGYKSLSNFYDAFKRELKITASEYRHRISISSIITKTTETANFINV
ncbi:helix-turn-helix domain-containing protein [Leptospira mtsangambouensis]|uniref:response regulator transcription factor n=1 Tax=Leptospira mtsangambouensis TaxID=2484912 RepID=UPI001EEA150C|nr:helix-turn-helix domain-containing protein [Leptospira mtsangambouensis]MCG6141620.1 helix-turn-helix domain-containing protein [Leptospira mtsangambouensis]